MIRCVKPFADKRNNDIRRQVGDEWQGTASRASEINTAMGGAYVEYFTEPPVEEMAAAIAAAVVEAITPLISGADSENTPAA